MTEKKYLETFEKCPGTFCFPLLMAITNFSENNKQTNGKKNKGSRIWDMGEEVRVSVQNILSLT